MSQHADSPAPVPAAPWFFAALLFVFALVVGLLAAFLLMPFEGWDEYQHLAVATHLDETGRMPQGAHWEEDGTRTPAPTVPRSLWPFLRSHPHPRASASQLHGLNVTTYAGERWDAQARQWRSADDVSVAPLHPPELYQAQHGPLYYLVLVGMKRALRLDDPLAWIEAARVLNALLFAAMVVCWFFLLHRLLQDTSLGWLAQVVPILMVLNPLLVLNAVRMANDALAIALGTLALLLYAYCFKTTNDSAETFDLRRRGMTAVVLGALVGLAVLTKASAVVFGPPLFCGLLWIAWQRRTQTHNAWWLPVLLAAGYLFTAGAYHLQTWQTYGTPTATQATVEYKAMRRGVYTPGVKGPATLGKGFAASFTVRRVLDLCLYDTWHGGGWSFRPPPGGLKRAYRWSVRLGALLLVLALVLPASRAVLRLGWARSWEWLLLLLCTWGALLYYGALSTVVWGRLVVNTWYAAPALPALFLLVLAGAAALRPVLGQVLALAVAAVYGVSIGTTLGVDLLAHQTRAAGVETALAELERHHAWLQLDAPMLTVAAGVLLGWLLWAARPNLRSFAGRIES